MKSYIRKFVVLRLSLRPLSKIEQRTTHDTLNHKSILSSARYEPLFELKYFNFDCRILVHINLGGILCIRRTHIPS